MSGAYRSQRDRVVGTIGAYYVATGVSPFVSRRAFEAATGPKREWWLVQTVGGLVLAAGTTMLAAAANRRVTPEIVGLAAGCAASLAAIDLVYVARGRIAPTYLADAVLEIAALAALAIAPAEGLTSTGRAGRGQVVSTGI